VAALTATPQAPPGTGADAAGPAPAAPPPADGTPAAAEVVKPLTLSWVAPPSAKVGQEFAVEVKARTEGALKGASLQLRYDPELFEVVAVEDGGFFGQVGGAAVFTPRVDAGLGVVFATAGASGLASTAGDAPLVRVRLKARKAATGTLQVGTIVAVDAMNRRVPIQGSAPLEIKAQP